MRLSDGDIEKRLADHSIQITPAPSASAIAGISVDCVWITVFVFSTTTPSPTWTFQATKPSLSTASIAS